MVRRNKNAQPPHKAGRSQKSSAFREKDTSELSLAALRLREAIEEAKVSVNGYQRSLECCAHDDESRSSLSIGVNNGKVLLKCFAGCTPEEIVASAGLSMVDLFPNGKGPTSSAPVKNDRKKRKPNLPTFKLNEWHKALLKSDKRLKYLADERGLTADTLEEHLIGWDERKQCYVIPIFEEVTERIDFDGREVLASFDHLVNVRRYDPNPPPDERKVKGLANAPASLYLFENVPKSQRRVLLVEGEWDALLARQNGFPAVTGTAGAETFKAEWVRELADHGVSVDIAYDCDEAGRLGAQKVADQLLDAGLWVKVVDLGLDDGEDITDWFVTHGKTAKDLRRLLGSTSASRRSDLRGSSAALGGKPFRHEIAESAFRGLAGDFVEAFRPETEADPAALLLTFLTAFGAMVGDGPHARVGRGFHPARLFTAIVGPTGDSGRKGMSWDDVMSIVAAADEDVFVSEHIRSGLSTGEGLIHALAINDLNDKRMLVEEPEFATVLKKAAADKSILSPILRTLWDRGHAENMTKGGAERVTGAHVCIVTHVTPSELARTLNETEQANGFANRFLLVYSQRSRSLPEGGDVPPEVISDLGRRLRIAVRQARKISVLSRSSEAKETWKRIYEASHATEDDLVSAVMARAAAQMTRLQEIYALLDGTSRIEVEHVEAAKAIWDYCCATAEYVFGEKTGDPLADAILNALRQSRAGKLSRTKINRLFSGNNKSSRIDLAIETLVRRELAKPEKVKRGGKGRPTEMVVLR